MSPSPALPAVTARPVAPAWPAATSIFLPKEHGSWSLALEPVALGLLAVPSLAGGALACAVVAGFFARRPLKIAAARVLALLAGLALMGLVEAGIVGGLAALWPLLGAAPLAALFLHFDVRNTSRAATAELTGTAAFAFVPATMGTLAGWPAASALALSVVILARSVPTVLVVRYLLRLAKGQLAGSGGAMLPVAGAGIGVVAVSGLALTGLVSAIAPGLTLILLARTVIYVMQRPPTWPARRIGVFEAALGALYVAAIALTWRHP